MPHREVLQGRRGVAVSQGMVLPGREFGARAVPRWERLPRRWILDPRGDLRGGGVLPRGEHVSHVVRRR